MIWQKWFLIVLFSLSAIINVLSVGLKRDPVTPGTAAGSLIYTAMCIAIVLSIPEAMS